MSFFYENLTVRGRDGRRVAIADCKLEPLNLLIPGNAPIVVPKKHAWRSPSQQTQTASRSKKANMDVVEDDYNADSEEEEEEGFDDNDTQPLIKSSQSKYKGKSKCKKDSMMKDKASEAKHHRRAERHEKKAKLEREEAAVKHERVQKRVRKGDAWLLRQKAREDTASENPSSKKKKLLSKKAAKVPDSDDGATTDGSFAVREMLANMKIRAGGKESPRFFPQPGDLPWSVSDDSQLIALKNDSANSYAFIGECMGRRAGEVKRRYKYLKDCDFQIPGGNETIEAETAEAEKTGMKTTDVEQTVGETTDAENTDGGGDITDAEKPDDQKKGGGGDWTEETDTQLWKLKNDGKTWAEIHAVLGGSKSGVKDRYKHLKSIDFNAPDDTAEADKHADEVEDDAADPASDGDLMAIASAYLKAQTEQVAKSPSKKSSQTRSKKSSNKAPAAPSRHAKNTSQALPGSGGEASYAGGSASDAGTNAYIAQYSRNLLAEANAGRTRIPEPDEIFDEDDCILLALADSRRRENRWLDIQADYFNVTGRMVPQEVLRWKLGGDEQPEGSGDEEN